MLPLVLAIISCFGFFLSLFIHIMAWFGYTHPILVNLLIPLVVSAFLIGAPGIFIFPLSPPTPNNWSRGTGHNFWRLIPKKGVILIRLAAIYGFSLFFFVRIFTDFNGFPGLLAITGVAITLFVFHWISYWYHSPVEIREDFFSMFKSKKHLKRHRKHDQE